MTLSKGFSILAGLLFINKTVTYAVTPDRLIFKIKPEYKQIVEDRDSDIHKWFLKITNAQAVRRFPRHKLPSSKASVLGRPLTDLSLIYELPVSKSLKTQFLLNQISKRPEVKYAEWEMLDAHPLFNPNDPKADSIVGSQHQILKKIMAYQAWNISKGDTNTIIGVLDTGTPVDHEDFTSQVKINALDPPNGIDDDHNGLIDDYRGWDFGSNDNNPTPDDTGLSPGHGTSVSSLSSAATNNGRGVAGTGFNCKILPIKIWNWNGSFSNFRGYDAIVYAADMGCKVINCSWGSARSGNQFEQDIINYATFNKSALIVAAGGNTAGFYNYLPANYEYVLGVTMTDSLDKIHPAASYNYKLDLSAPGVGIYGIQTNGNYGWVDGGSSMASPVVAGAAGLVRSKFPNLNGIQAGELLRVNSDTIYNVPGNQTYRDKAGRGRLNMLKALQRQQSISLRPIQIQVRNKHGIQAKRGDTVSIFVRFENYLDSISGFQAIASSNSGKLQFLQNTRNYGGMSSFSGQWETVPFYAIVGSNMNSNELISIQIQVKVGNQYEDHRWFQEYFNGIFLDLDANDVRMTVTANGRQGFLDVSNYVGSGIQYKGSQYCGEAGLMVGINATQVSNSVYDTTGKDDHFKIENNIRFMDYQTITQHTVHHFNDSAAGTKRIGIGVKQSSFEFDVDSLSGSVFLNYQITNRNENSIDSLCVAQYNDWEVENLNYNFARWDSILNLGYTFGSIPQARFAAVQVLTGGEPQFYAIEALNNTANGNINLFNGFSLAEKWQMMSNGIGRGQAGTGVLGDNIVQVTGVKMRDLQPGETRKVTFAYVFAESLAELKAKARINQNLFKTLNTSPSPSPKVTKFCSGDSIVDPFEMPLDIRKFIVSKIPSTTDPVHSGTSFSAVIKTDSTLYVTGNDSLFQGYTAAWNWQMIPTPTGKFFSNSVILSDTVLLGDSLQLTAFDSSTTLMNRWAINGLTLPDTGFKIKYTFDALNFITVCLQQTNRELGCNNISCKIYRVVQPVENQKLKFGDKVFIFPNPAKEFLYFRGDFHAEEFSITDCTGKILQSNLLNGKIEKVSISGIPPGVYFWTLRSGEKLDRGKVVIR